MPSRRSLTAGLLLTASLASAALIEGQAPAVRSAPPLTVLSKDSRRPLTVVSAGAQEMVSLEDLASFFQLTVKEDTMAGGITVTHANKTIVLSPTQGLASAAGRLVALPVPPVRAGASWLVPLDFLGRALPLILDTRLELRRASRLVVFGDLRVPRIVVRHDPGANEARVTFDITPRTPHTVEQDANRLTVRFEADVLDTDIAPPDHPDLITAIRVVEPLTAVTIELGPRYSSYRASDAPVEPNATRLTLDLFAVPAASTTQAGGVPVPGTPLPPPEAPPITFEPPASAIRTVVIDPGHGGPETGSKGTTGTLEKDVVLSMSRQLKAMLEGRLGLRVLLTRDGDQAVPLDERAAIANNNKADLFVSVHANASVRASLTGAEVFYLSVDEYGQEAQRLATSEGTRLPTVGGGERDIDVIPWEMAQARHLQDSSMLASIVEQQLRTRIQMSARALQQAPFRVLVGANMPAVLVETGFMTNPQEEARLASAAWQNQVVQGLYESVVRFRAYIEGGRRAAPPVSPAAPAGATSPGTSPTTGGASGGVPRPELTDRPVAAPGAGVPPGRPEANAPVAARPATPAPYGGVNPAPAPPNSVRGVPIARPGRVS